MIINFALELIIKLLVYSLFFLGVWLLCKPYLYPVNKSIILFFDKWQKRYQNIDSSINKGVIYSFYHHIDMLLQATWRWYKPNAPVYFFILSLSIFLSTFSIFSDLTKSWLLTISCSILSSLLPYSVLKSILQINRSNTSHQLVPAVTLLLASYRICSKDIYYALLRTIKKLDNLTIKKSLITLAKKIQSHKNHSEVERAVELFVFKIQTSWAKQLGVIILNAVVDGRDIEQSLSNIVNDMREGQQIIEEEKSQSHDTVLLGYFPLLAFPLTIFFLHLVSGQFNVLYYQFKTTQGLTSFIVTTMICITGFILASVFRKPKNDL